VRLTVDGRQTPPRVVVARNSERTGRGAYLCRRQACLDKALHRRAFQRSFRASVAVAEEEIAEELAGKRPGRDGEDG
jgi:predicted RNA-binding protein YlxR (DUF448 family)